MRQQTYPEHIPIPFNRDLLWVSLDETFKWRLVNAVMRRHVAQPAAEAVTIGLQIAAKPSPKNLPDSFSKKGLSCRR
jgi:hypothetical protein